MPLNKKLIEGNATKYGIILAQNVNFVTTLPGPLMGMGVLYPRVQDFLVKFRKLRNIQGSCRGQRGCEVGSKSIKVEHSLK